MDHCPHCEKELPGEPCPACGHLALPGAGFCHTCGHQLTAGETREMKLLTCSSCGRPALPAANYCHHCGDMLGDGQASGEGWDSEVGPGSDERIACSDGLCVGIIGPDGKCVECGKPFAGPVEAGAAAGEEE